MSDTDAVAIPGGTATLRTKLTVRQRRPLITVSAVMSKDLKDKVEAAPEDENGDVRMDTIGLTEPEAEVMQRMQEATVVVFLESWTLEQPLPTMDTVGDLDADIFDALSVAVAKRGAKEILNGIGETGPDGVTDPESPTGPSSD